LFDGVVDNVLRALVVAALLRQNEYAKFHDVSLMMGNMESF
jgi:hypothetical protein